MGDFAHFQMICFIKAHVQIYLEMHTHRHRYRTSGFASIMFLLLGIAIFLGIYTGYLRIWNWPLIMIGAGIFIFIISASSNRRRRVQQRSGCQTQQRTNEQYVPTKNPFFEREEKEYARQQEITFRTNNELIFCSYCGMKMQQKVRFCSNCGNQSE